MRTRFSQELKAQKDAKNKITQQSNNLLLTSKQEFKSEKLTALQRLQKEKNLEMKVEVGQVTNTLLR